jgi:hypothetical protein
MNKILSVAALSLSLISWGSVDFETENNTKIIKLGVATVEIVRDHSDVSIEVSGVPKGAELSITRGALAIEEVGDGVYEDNLSGSRADSLYIFSLETPEKVSQSSLSNSRLDPNNDEFMHLDLVAASAPGIAADPMSAYASTALPSRTRFRYQTFIPEAEVDSPPIVCGPISDEFGNPLSSFLGDNRSWNPDSESYKTRSDVVVDWDGGGSITPYFSVGESTQILRFIYPLSFLNSTIVLKDTASSSSMKLVKGAASSDYVSFHIYSDVVNPFCNKFVTRGIFYDFAFYVHRTGEFVVKGTFRQVPNHELYTRNNVATSWRTIFQRSNQGFNCLATIFGDCQLYKFINGDLVP